MALEEKGWKKTTIKEFLNLTEDDEEYIENKLRMENIKKRVTLVGHYGWNL